MVAEDRLEFRQILGDLLMVWMPRRKKRQNNAKASVLGPVAAVWTGPVTVMKRRKYC